MYTFSVHNGMTVAQRDLPWMASTFQAMKLLESTILYVLKGAHNNKHSRQQLGMNNRRDWGHMSIA